MTILPVPFFHEGLFCKFASDYCTEIYAILSKLKCTKSALAEKGKKWSFNVSST